MNMGFLSVIDEKETMLTRVADYIWAHPETAFSEYKSSAYLCGILRDEGFDVTENLSGISTAFLGRYGHGKPVIGILGEFDALENLGQAGCVTEKCPTGTKCGHGCGHNLLGTASLGAAIAVKRFLESTGHSGTVVFFGCPGEEGGSGKTFMARDGVFDEIDAAFCWHPDEKTGVRARTSLANCEILYKFDGVAAHASKQPQLGRSALDAVELMNVGVNYMREHMISDARVHYAVVDTGGTSPSIVQAHAEVLYLIRAPYNCQVKELADRVDEIARGAALMTGTKQQSVFVKACSNTILNDTLQQVLYRCMQSIELPEITESDIAFARELTEKALADVPQADPNNPLHYELEAYTGQVEKGSGSTDVGDVSWICPTAQIKAATLAYGTPNHSWQQTTQGVTPLAHKMIGYVAKVLAAASVELICNDDILCKAKAEHKERIGPEGYICPIPKSVSPTPTELLHK